MRPNRRYVNDLIIDQLSVRWDGQLSEFGFKRRRRSLKYARVCPDADQEVEFGFEMGPRFAPSAIAHLQPTITVRVNSVQRLADAIAGDDPEYFRTRQTVMYFTQMYNIRTFRKATAHEVVYDRESLIVAMEVFREHFLLSVLPFLDQYSTPQGLIDLFEGGELGKGGGRGAVLIGAAYLLLGRREEAVALWKKRIDQPGLQRAFPRVIAYTHALERGEVGDVNY